MNIGLVSVSFRQHSPEEIITACTDCGIAAIEWGSDIHAPADNISALRKIVKLQSEYGVRCCSYGTYFRIGQNAPEDIYAYIRAAELLGTRTLRIWCGTKDSCKYDSRERAALFCDCEAVCKIAEAEGVRLCTEFHNNTFTDRAERVSELCGILHLDSFGSYWQPNQYRTFDENLASAEKVASITENIHVFNWSGEERYPLAEAHREWCSYLSRFSGEHYALLEFMPDGKISSLPTEVSALRNILGEIK